MLWAAFEFEFFYFVSWVLFLFIYSTNLLYKHCNQISLNIDAQKSFKWREITQNNLLSEMDGRIQGIYLTALTLIPELDNFQRHICAVRARDETNASFSHAAILYYRDTYVLSTFYLDRLYGLPRLPRWWQLICAQGTTYSMQFDYLFLLFLIIENTGGSSHFLFAQPFILRVVG